MNFEIRKKIILLTLILELCAVVMSVALYQNNVGFESMSSNLAVQKLLVFAYSSLYFVIIIIWINSAKLRFQFEKLYLMFVISSGLMLRLLIAPWIQNTSLDINYFQQWAHSAANGLTWFYEKKDINFPHDYPPLYIYILYVLGKFSFNSFVINNFGWIIKLPAIIFDILSSFMVFLIFKKINHNKLGISMVILYLFNPVILIDSTVWGQVDSIFSFLIALAILLLIERKHYTSTIFFALAVMMKPQGIIVLPILAYELIRNKKVSKIVISLIIFLFVVFIVTFPFSKHTYGGIFWIFYLLTNTIGEYPVTTLNAFNFYNLIGLNNQPANSIFFLFTYHMWGTLAIIIISLFSLFSLFKKNDVKILPIVAMIQVYGIFVFSTGMHERYLYPCIILSLLSFCYLNNKRYMFLFIGISLTCFTNIFTQLYFSSFTSGGSLSFLYKYDSFGTSLLNIVFFGYLIWLTFQELNSSSKIVLLK